MDCAAWSILRVASDRGNIPAPRKQNLMRMMNQTRRTFLSRTALAATAALVAPRDSRAQENAVRKIGLGFSLYGARSLNLSAALQAASEIGYDCVELPVMPDWPADSARFSTDARTMLSRELAERSLRLTALMENLPAVGDAAQHAAHLERLKRAAQLARDLSDAGRARPLIETILGGSAGEFEQMKERLVERLRDYAAVAADAEVVLAVKAHVGNATQRPEQLLVLLDAVASPWLKAAYDYSHFELQRIDMRATTDALLPRTAFVHVKDTEHAQGKRGFLLPGEGSTDYVALLKLIGQASYRGDVVVEVSSQVFNRAGYDPLTAMHKCYNCLAPAFRQAGLKRS